MPLPCCRPGRTRASNDPSRLCDRRDAPSAGLTQTVAGIHRGVADEIPMPGEGHFALLFQLGGNPVISWPDHLRPCVRCYRSNLFVQFVHGCRASAACRLRSAPTIFY